MTIEELEEKNKELEKQLKAAMQALYFYSDMEHCWETLSMTYAPANSKDEVINESKNGFYMLEDHYPIENGDKARRAIERIEAIKKKRGPYRQISEIHKQMREMNVGDTIYIPAEMSQRVYNYISQERIHNKCFKISRSSYNGKKKLTRLEDYDLNEVY